MALAFAATLTACNSGSSDNQSSNNADLYSYALQFEPESSVNLNVNESAYFTLYLISNNPGSSGNFTVELNSSNESAILYYPKYGCAFNYPEQIKCYVGVLKIAETESPVVLTPKIPGGYNFTYVETLTIK